MTIEERLTALETDVQELKEAYRELAGGRTYTRRDKELRLQ